MGTQQTLERQLNARKKLVDKTLLSLLRTTGAYKRFPMLDNSLKHTLLLKGKRLRPILALLTYELFEEDAAPILPVACALELIHAGSLMLDDLPSMDNATYRRGEKTNHVLYGDATTILASAALWVEAFGLLATSEHGRELSQETTRHIGKDGLVLGQYMDLFAFNKKQSIGELERCYELKTGTLFRLATTYGAILGGASKKELSALQDFGAAFGLAYQIRDDIIDATETIEQSGKDAQKDADNHKPNYVSLLGLEGAKKALQAELERALNELSRLPRETSVLKQLVAAISL